MQKRSTSSARIVHPEMRHQPEKRYCSGSQIRKEDEVWNCLGSCVPSGGPVRMIFRDVDVRTTEEQNFVRGVEKHEEQVRRQVNRLHQLE